MSALRPPALADAPARALEDVAVEREAPLSSVQEGMWFLTQLEGAPAYMFQGWLRMHGRLDRAALVDALAEIIRRHSALRTSFFTVRGKPFQRVHASHAPAIEVRSLVGAPPEVVGRELDRAVREVVTRPFDPTRLPLIRWTLFELGEHEHLLLHAEHHLIHDGWSFVLFADELARLYRAAARGASADLPPPSLQYWELALRDRETADARIARGLDYWREQLRDMPPGVTLPLDRPRPAVQRFHGSTHDFTLEPELADRVRAAAREMRGTLFSFMFAAFAVLLHRYSGETDVAVGSGFANRSHADVERMIGMLVNTVVLRVRVDDDPTAAELVSRVQDVVFHALDHEDVPFSVVVKDLNVGRSLSANPISPVLFSFHDAPLPHVDDDELTIDVREGLNAGAAKVDLDIVVVTSTRRRLLGPESAEADSIRLIWDYSTELFERETVVRMAEHYLDVLEAFCMDPRRRISELRLGGEARALALGAPTTPARARDVDTVVALFEEQARRTPGATAIVHPGGTITYGELNADANRVARELRRLGVGQEARVGIHLERSPELVLAILGVLKAGAAYVPLDPAFPDDRLAWTVDDAAVTVVIGRGPGSGSRLADAVGVPGLDVEDRAWRRHDDADLGAPIHPRSICHVLYTSGSTGTPRGVAIEHRSLANFVTATADDFAASPGDRILQFASFAFDTHAEEVFVALCTGATLVVAGDAVEPDALLRHVDRDGITILDLPTGYWSELVRVLDGGRSRLPARVRLVAVGGEAMTAAAARAWAGATEREVRLRNGYGPTEATGVATAADLSREDCLSGRQPPIGAPLPGIGAYVADDALRPVPVGVPGELLIGGEAVARGYLGRPGWTAERFLPDPFSGVPGGRPYRTGDRVRWRPDGRLEFLGRLDDQIKIRGFRIEPAEVEAAIRAAVPVEDALVVVREDRPGDRRLVAYLVGWDARVPSVAEVREALLTRLPNYMVPSVFVPLERRPLTATGKLDARALPAPDASTVTRDESPASPLEHELQTIWREILGTERVGVTDNFFELGGDSLLSMQMIAVADERGIRLSLTDVFERQTIRGLADVAAPARAA